MEAPLDGQRTPARPSAKLRFSLSQEQLDWLDEESQQRNVDKSTLLSEIFQRGSAPALAPVVAAPVVAVAPSFHGVPDVLLTSGRSPVSVAGLVPGALPAPPVAVQAPFPELPPVAEAVQPVAPVQVEEPAAAVPASEAGPESTPDSEGLASWIPGLSGRQGAPPAGGLPRGAIVLVPGRDGYFAPTRVSPDLFQDGARLSVAQSFFGASRLTRWLVAVALALVLLGLGVRTGMGVLSSRYEFREVAVSPGRSMYYRVDTWTGDMVRCRTDLGPVGSVC